MFVVSGPSGVGKGTVIQALLKRDSGLVLAVSASTRKPRPGEVDGQHYYFKSAEEFKRLVNEDEFLEWAEVHGNCYGTLRSDVVAKQQKGVAK